MGVRQSTYFSRLSSGAGANGGGGSAQYVIDAEMLTHVVRATRAVEEGEEITISCELHLFEH
jgi:hypothetical protein